MAERELTRKQGIALFAAAVGLIVGMLLLALLTRPADTADPAPSRPAPTAAPADPAPAPTETETPAPGLGITDGEGPRTVVALVAGADPATTPAQRLAELRPAVTDNGYAQAEAILGGQDHAAVVAAGLVRFFEADRVDPVPGTSTPDGVTLRIDGVLYESDGMNADRVANQSWVVTVVLVEGRPLVDTITLETTW